MKTSARGFTLVETLAIIVILGLTSAWAVAKLSAFLKAKKLEGEARTLFSAIGYARSQALKKDVAYLILFDVGTNRYSMYEDRNGNGVAEVSELVSSQSLAQAIAFGVAPGGPSMGPSGTGSPAAKLEAGWKTALILDRDRAATINVGALYLCSPSLKANTFCIRMPAGSRRMELWRWDGSRWISL